MDIPDVERPFNHNESKLIGEMKRVFFLKKNRKMKIKKKTKKQMKLIAKYTLKKNIYIHMRIKQSSM